MAKETRVINILTYRLPFELANQIYNEYESRLREVRFLVAEYKTYRILENDLNTVELFLALSIFKKRVVSNFSGVAKFYNTVTRNSEADEIRIGSFIINSFERYRLLEVVNSYNALLQKFSIPPRVMDYDATTELLQQLLNLKFSLENGENQERKGRGKRGNRNDSEEDFTI